MKIRITTEMVCWFCVLTELCIWIGLIALYYDGVEPPFQPEGYRYLLTAFLLSAALRVVWKNATDQSICHLPNCYDVRFRPASADKNAIDIAVQLRDIHHISIVSVGVTMIGLFMANSKVATLALGEATPIMSGTLLAGVFLHAWVTHRFHSVFMSWAWVKARRSQPSHACIAPSS